MEIKLNRVSVAPFTPHLALDANCRRSMQLATDVISRLHKNLSIHLAIIDVRATGRKSLNCLVPFFLAICVMVYCFHERGIECVFKTNWKNLVKKGQTDPRKFS